MEDVRPIALYFKGKFVEGRKGGRVWKLLRDNDGIPILNEAKFRFSAKESSGKIPGWAISATFDGCPIFVWLNNFTCKGSPIYNFEDNFSDYRLKLGYDNNNTDHQMFYMLCSFLQNKIQSIISEGINDKFYSISPTDPNDSNIPLPPTLLRIADGPENYKKTNGIRKVKIGKELKEIQVFKGFQKIKLAFVRDLNKSSKYGNRVWNEMEEFKKYVAKAGAENKSPLAPNWLYKKIGYMNFLNIKKEFTEQVSSE